jgi:hypothetical protein
MGEVGEAEVKCRIGQDLPLGAEIIAPFVPPSLSAGEGHRAEAPGPVDPVGPTLGG